MWGTIAGTLGQVYNWPKSTYIAKPPFFDGFSMTPAALAVIKGARVLGIFGDSVTTDHISPAGAIKENSPAGKWLIDHGVTKADFNSYGSRRGNHEVMMRGTFANVRIKNLMIPPRPDGTREEGGVTLFQPSGEKMFIYDAAMKYIAQGTPTVVFGGEEYGTGSSRDWAAKGTQLLGVKAVIAKSFERIHRSNLMAWCAGAAIQGQRYGAVMRSPAKGPTSPSLPAFGATGPALNHPSQGRRGRTSRCSAGSTRRSRSTITREAASCRSCCGNWSRRDAPLNHPSPHAARTEAGEKIPRARSLR